MKSENTKTKNQKLKTKKRFVWFFFALLIIFVYFFGLSVPLVGPDEARYAQVAREMFERNDFVTPTLGGFDWFEKPALLYWLQIVSYKIFGVSEFAARFGSALFGLGTILSLWILGCFFSAETQKLKEIKLKIKDQKQKTDFAGWLALIAASSIGLIVFARGASFDIILTFPLTASLVGFFIFDLKQNRKNAKTQSFSLITYYLSLIAFYFFTGVALIAKGLVGIVFPFSIVAFYYVLSRRFPPKTFLVSLLWGTILSFSVAAIWYVPMYQANGWKFVDEFFIQHHFQRFTSDKYQHHQPFWFFFLVLPLMTIPWLPFFLASIWNFLKNFFYRGGAETRRDEKILIAHRSSLTTFAFAWMTVPLVFFTFSGSKLPGYILPALPGALILTAEYVYKFVQKSAARKNALQITAFAVFLLVIISLQFFVPQFADRDSVKVLIETADSKGYANDKIVNLYTVSHNAEFYAAKRLIREQSGKAKRYDDFSKLIEDMKSANMREILVLVSRENLKEITGNNLAAINVLADNGDTAIVLVKIN